MAAAFPFLEMFYEYQPDEPLRAVLEQAAVCHAEIDREAKTVELRLSMQAYCPEETLDAVSKALCELYGFRSAAILPQFPAQLLSSCEAADLNRILIGAYSPAAASLAGCQWELGEEKSVLHLRANGKDELSPHIPLVERYLAERFGVASKIEIVCGSETDFAVIPRNA